MDHAQYQSTECQIDRLAHYYVAAFFGALLGPANQLARSVNKEINQSASWRVEKQGRGGNGKRGKTVMQVAE